MSKRHHYRRAARREQQADIEITTFLNLIVVLIPFLLVTAVFSRITIQELNLPTAAAGGEKPDKPLVTVEVILRENKMELSDGSRVTATIRRKDGKHDIAKLSERLLKLKRKYAGKEDATLLVEPDVEYEDVIHVMDAMKVAEVRQDGLDEVLKVELFPQLSLGDAP